MAKYSSLFLDIGNIALDLLLFKYFHFELKTINQIFICGVYGEKLKTV